MASPRTKKVTGPEIGESGVQIFNGVISGEEYNRKLDGISAMRIYDEMRRSDGTISAMLKAVKLPVQSVKWYVEAASDDAKDQEINELVDYNLFQLLKWRQKLTEILTYLDFGFSVFEMVFEPREVNGKQRIVLSKLAFRKQTTITAWEADKGVPGVTQMTTEGKTLRIPLNKLIVFTNEMEGDNYAGRSILRPAYRHWFYIDGFYRMEAIGAEKQGLGIIKIKHPKGADDKSIRKAEQAARNIRVNEEAYIREPDGWDINFMDMKANTTKDTTKLISHHVREAQKSVLTQFLELGAQGGSGSRAVSEDHSKLFMMANESVASYICDIMSYAIKTLVDLNFNTDSYPELRFGKFDDDNMSQVAEAASKFITSGLMSVSDEDDAHVRNLLGFPEREIEGDEDTGTSKDVKDKQSADDINDEVKAAEKLHASITRRLYGRSSRTS